MKGFQSGVISVDMLNVIDPKFGNTRLNLHKLDTVMPCKRLISHFLIRAEDSAVLRCSPINDCMSDLIVTFPRVATLLTALLLRSMAQLTHTFSLRNTSLSGSSTALMRFLPGGVPALVRQGEEGFVGFDYAAQAFLLGSQQS